MKSHKPRTAILVAPSDSPHQEVYRGHLSRSIGRHFETDIRCASHAEVPTSEFENLRHGLSLAMLQTERLFLQRNDLEYGALVLPLCVEQGPGSPKPPFPVVLTTMRTWQCTEFVFAFPVNNPVPDVVLAEIADSIGHVLTVRENRECTDSAEQNAVDLLMRDIRIAVDGALDETLAQMRNVH